MNQAVKDFLSKVNLAVATPCYGGVVTEQYARSLVNFTSLCGSVGLKTSFMSIANESLVTRARNELAMAFLRDKSLTHLMFVDADIVFSPNSIINMLLKDVDIVAGAYPLKSISWEDVYEQKDNFKNIDELIKASTLYVINVDKPDEARIGQTKQVKVHGGLLPVHDAGTGFMLIKRNVFEKMINAYPEIVYYSDKDLSIPKEQRKMYAFFDTSIDEDGRYLSEDYTFCRRWQKLDGVVNLDTTVTLNHIGSYVFQGKSVLN